MKSTQSPTKLSVIQLQAGTSRVGNWRKAAENLDLDTLLQAMSHQQPWERSWDMPYTVSTCRADLEAVAYRRTPIACRRWIPGEHLATYPPASPEEHLATCLL